MMMTTRSACYAGLFLLLFSFAFISLVTAEDCAKAREYYDRGTNLLNYEERRVAFQKATDLCPSYAEAHVNLADAYENLGDFHNAERHYQEALNLRQDIAAAYIGLGEVYLKTGRYSLAGDIFLKGLAIRPDDERLQAGSKVAAERLQREKKFYDTEQIRSCLVADEDFQLMCMCPGDHYSFLKKWICVPPILFPSGSASLSPKSRKQLDEIGKALKSKELSGKKWLVIGHADIIGTPERNQQYSEHRAKAVKDYLSQKFSINPESLNATFFGQGRPRATNDTLEGRAENRRVEIVLNE